MLGKSRSKSAAEITLQAPDSARAQGAQLPAATPGTALDRAETCRSTAVSLVGVGRQSGRASQTVGGFGLMGHGRLLAANRVSVLTSNCVLNGDSSNLTILLVR